MAYGDTPYLVRGSQEDYKEIFYSDPEAALTVPIQVMAGYGELPAGTLMAQNLSSDSSYYLWLVPYNPTTINNTTQDQPGRAFLLSDVSSGTTIEVTKDDSYKFNVDDEVILNDSSTADEDLGAITAIDRTTYTNKAQITVTNSVSGSFTTANAACLSVKAGDSSNQYSDAVGVLMKDVDAGTGENSKGASAQIVVSNAVFYTGMLNLKDSAGATDISMSDIGNYSYLK